MRFSNAADPGTRENTHPSPAEETNRHRWRSVVCLLRPNEHGARVSRPAASVGHVRAGPACRQPSEQVIGLRHRGHTQARRRWCNRGAPSAAQCRAPCTQRRRPATYCRQQVNTRSDTAPWDGPLVGGRRRPGGPTARGDGLRRPPSRRGCLQRALIRPHQQQVAQPLLGEA